MPEEGQTNLSVVGVREPFFVGNTKYAQLAFDGEYLHFFWTANLALQWVGLRSLYTLSYGTYQWKGYINAIANITYFVGLLERHAGQSNEGAILAYYASGNYYFKNSEGGSEQVTTLSGQDWTTLKTFKVVWSATDVYFYVDDVEVAHHTTNIPISPMSLLFGEFAGGAVAPASNCHMYLKDFREL